MIESVKNLLLGLVTMCSACGAVFRERKRKPCPRCGGLPRTIQRFANDYIGAEDHAN